MHVLATPPAFRLSQDQTLQLNFLAQVVPDARRQKPLAYAQGSLTETDTFTTCVNPRNESVQTHRIKTFLRQAVTAPAPAKGRGSVAATSPPASRGLIVANARLKHIFDGLLKQNDQGRSLTCVHHEDVLRYKSGRSPHPPDNPLTGCPAHAPTDRLDCPTRTGTPARPSSHPRG